MTAYFLAIDGGSQSTKVSVVDDAGVVHATAQDPLQAYELSPGGRAVHPGDDLWDSLGRASRAALERYAGEPGDVVAVGLCGIRSTRALVGADGHLVEPVLSWMDARVSRPLGPDRDVDTVTSAGGYLTIRLTGERRDTSAAFRGMWPIDVPTSRWSSDPAAWERTGMRPRQLPELVDPGDLLGHLHDAGAAHLGLPAGTPVQATANDKAVEALGCGVLDEGTTLLSLGTYIASMTPGRVTETSDDRFWVNAAAIPGRFLHESGGIRRGMWTLTWLQRLVSAAAPDLVDPDEVQRWLTEGATGIAPGCGGLVTIPDWLPPDDAPHRRGVILGLEAAHGAHHLYRSIIEGIALTMRGHIEAMEEALGRRAERLVVSGGGSRSPLMSQIVADVLARPVERAGLPDAAALGAAICAAVGHGTHPDWETAVAAMVRPGAVVRPDDEASRAYDDVATTYARATRLSDAMLADLARP